LLPNRMSAHAGQRGKKSANGEGRLKIGKKKKEYETGQSKKGAIDTARNKGEGGERHP